MPSAAILFGLLKSNDDCGLKAVLITNSILQRKICQGKSCCKKWEKQTELPFRKSVCWVFFKTWSVIGGVLAEFFYDKCFIDYCGKNILIIVANVLLSFLMKMLIWFLLICWWKWFVDFFLKMWTMLCWILLKGYVESFAANAFLLICKRQVGFCGCFIF